MIRDLSILINRTFTMNAKHRIAIIDRMIEISFRYAMKPAVVVLAVSLTDNFLAKETVSKSRLELVAITALWIATKYENVCQFRVSILTQLFKFYTKTQFLNMEKCILNTLKFRLSRPTAFTYCQRYLANIEAHHEFAAEVYFVLLTSLLRPQKFKPSEVAKACICRVARDHNINITGDCEPECLLAISQHSDSKTFISRQKGTMRTYKHLIHELV